MPRSDIPFSCINVASGQTRTNNFWILGRVLRDIEKSLEPKKKAGLCVFVYNAHGPGGVPSRDWLWYSSVFVIIIQCGIATVPLALFGDWTILMLALMGNILALMGEALSQWAQEKWACRTNNSGQYGILRGNGYRHVVVIRNTEFGCLNLEDLASAKSHSQKVTKFAMSALIMGWVLFLLNVAGVRDHQWYLLGIGFLGMVQNLIVAGAARLPKSFGMYLKLVDRIEDVKVMKALERTEILHPATALHLIKIFFPEGLRGDEKDFWKEMKNTVDDRKVAAEEMIRKKSGTPNTIEESSKIGGSNQCKK